jgi:hypothetical protein
MKKKVKKLADSLREGIRGATKETSSLENNLSKTSVIVIHSHISVKY